MYIAFRIYNTIQYTYIYTYIQYKVSGTYEWILFLRNAFSTDDEVVVEDAWEGTVLVLVVVGKVYKDLEVLLLLL